MKLMQVEGYKGKDGKGRTIIVAHAYDNGLDEGYGLWVLCENYKLGRIVKTWRYITQKQTKDEAIFAFNKRNKIKN